MAFPNPVNEVLNLNYSIQNDSKVEITLLDIAGKVVKQSTQLSSKGENSVSINVSDVSTGMYLLKLQTSEGVKTQKVLIQH